MAGTGGGGSKILSGSFSAPQASAQPVSWPLVATAAAGSRAMTVGSTKFLSAWSPVSRANERILSRMHSLLAPSRCVITAMGKAEPYAVASVCQTKLKLRQLRDRMFVTGQVCQRLILVLLQAAGFLRCFLRQLRAGAGVSSALDYPQLPLLTIYFAGSS